MTPDDLTLTPTGLRFAGRRIPCTIGRGGITDAKREGDGATPRGVHRVSGVLYRPDRIVPPVSWAVPIGPRDIWSDDPTDPEYNHMTRSPSTFGHERLRRADPLYDLVILTDWNWPDAEPGRGSAIFLHRWRRPGYPTEGCVAMAPADLNWVARRLTLDTRLIV
ncbi:L,D-peptidoglycan transpeptidase YkuD, ErfK/YbiS/YcfS/YnhG family [Palleronia marisminoris]|uniref:L,D-transpeptidase catalytic domain n=1 Tax=Palleronia marisminoris TaxID=315423 RepID=A0A1Y5SND6_9RHOB|nr:L,D-transpeptidase family protein [Palleronia marisminoris]SFG87194.1 L,D-peptidoglycan transpeptidase YkuD, ErfK/YbiS/YcfS/YnhG family [Palleronia marisminoris]SLN43031.1 L,D-transpeptidase catalytic domain [Palleronia marisminoris]